MWKITGDYVGPTDEAFYGETSALITQDEASEYAKVAGVCDQTAVGTREAWRRMWAFEHGRDGRLIHIFYCDNADSFKKEFKTHLEDDLKITIQTALENEPETNARQEGLNRRVKEKTAAAMVNAAIPYEF